MQYTYIRNAFIYALPVVNVVRWCQVALSPCTRLHEVMVQHERCILIGPHIQHQYEQMDVQPRSPVNLLGNDRKMYMYYKFSVSGVAVAAAAAAWCYVYYMLRYILCENMAMMMSSPSPNRGTPPSPLHIKAN